MVVSMDRRASQVMHVQVAGQRYKVVSSSSQAELSRLAAAVDAKLADPSDAELEAFYFGQRNPATVPFEQVKNQLAPTLKQRKAERARQDYIRGLRRVSDVTVLLRLPKVQVTHDPARVMGDPNAPVTIVEFSDFQCPYCKKVQASLNALLAKYHGHVKLAYRDFPIRTLHPQAHLAAEAARCAGEQGKFWEYHDLLFARQLPGKGWDFHALATELGLQQSAFDVCLNSGRFRQEVAKDLQDGLKLGITSTPTFFINGRPLVGAQPLAAFQALIDRMLEHQSPS